MLTELRGVRITLAKVSTNQSWQAFCACETRGKQEGSLL
jgi:hypothetical protein